MNNEEYSNSSLDNKQEMSSQNTSNQEFQELQEMVDRLQQQNYLNSLRDDQNFKIEVITRFQTIEAEISKLKKGINQLGMFLSNQAEQEEFVNKGNEEA
jgi:hypothetical protein